MVKTTTRKLFDAKKTKLMAPKRTMPDAISGNFYSAHPVEIINKSKGIWSWKVLWLGSNAELELSGVSRHLFTAKSRPKEMQVTIDKLDIVTLAHSIQAEANA